MPSTDQMTAAVHAYIAGFANSDPAAIAALFADDATVADPLGTPVKRGKGEILEFYTGSMATGAKLELLGDLRCAGDHVAFPFAVKLEFGGQTSVIEVIDTFRIDDAGKIAEMRAFWGPANIKSA